jgi:hypothetical protein
MILASVTAVHDDGVQLLINGEDKPTDKHYQCQGAFKPVVGQAVSIAKVGTSYLVVGPYGAPRKNTAVAAITAASPTVTDCVSKINELIAALKANGTID